MKKWKRRTPYLLQLRIRWRNAKTNNTLAERKNKRSSSENVKEFVVDDAVVDEAKEFLAKIFKAMKIEVVMEKFVNKKDGCVVLKLHGDDMGILIGKHGQTLGFLTVSDQSGGQ